MNSKVIALVVGAVVVVGGGYFVLNSYGEGGAVAGAATNGTFASLMANGQNLECTFEHNDGTNVSSGTVYIASGGDQIRGDFTIEQSEAGAQEAHMIRTGGYNYIWGSSLDQGIKTQITAENKNTLFDDETGAVDENTDFECNAWNVDQGKFSVPSNVTFMDMSAQMGAMMEAQGEAMGEMKAAQCAACNQIAEGSARQQCLQALSCN